MQNMNNTQYFRVEKEPEIRVHDVLKIVYEALSEKGYNPVNQIVGYIISIQIHGSRRQLMRIIGLDFGSKTVGVAVSDELLITAQGIEIVRRKSENKLRQTLARIEELIKEYNVEKIVLGFPKNMNNSEGERCEKTLEFKEMLERRTGLTVELWDERLTTVAADNLMMEAGIRRENRKEYVDQIAASFILQGYLDYLQNEKNQE